MRSPSPSSRCRARSSSSIGPRPTATNRTLRHPVDHLAGGREQVGVALGRPEVGDRADHDLVVGDAEQAALLGPVLALAAGARPRRRRTGSPGCGPGSRRAASRGPLRTPRGGSRTGPSVRRSARRVRRAWLDQTLCSVTTIRGRLRPRQRAHRQTGADGHERRMDVDDVELRRRGAACADGRSTGIPRRPRSEADDRPALQILQGWLPGWISRASDTRPRARRGLGRGIGHSGRATARRRPHPVP